VLTRRQLVRSGALAAGSFTIAPAFWRTARASAASPARPAAGPYGELGPADINGIRLPKGFSSRVIARGGQPVLGTDYLLPAFPDGSATYALPDGGWILTVNSEVPSRGGGASAIVFGPDGAVKDAYRILGNTSGNCAGGKTPWGTWLSCEEVDDGLIWECDPTGARPAVVLPALGRFKHEAAAVDPVHQHVYLTEDLGDGGLYRFTPDRYPELLKGQLEAAIVAPGGKVSWAPIPRPDGGSADPTRKQVAGMTQFKRGEGIWFDAGIVYVATTADNKVHALDTRDQTISLIYDQAAFANSPMVNPDNVTVSPAGELFVGEDDGGDDPLDLCVITPEGEIARFLKLTGTQHGTGEAISEVTGPSLNPAGTRLYVSSQRGFGLGVVYEVSGPFRTQRPAGARGDAATATKPVRAGAGLLGLESARTLRLSLLRRRGLAVGLTLPRAATVELTLRARLTVKPGRPRREVVLARVTRRIDQGPEAITLSLSKTGRRVLAGRRQVLGATLTARVDGRRVERRVRLVP